MLSRRMTLAVFAVAGLGLAACLGLAAAAGAGGGLRRVHAPQLVGAHCLGPNNNLRSGLIFKISTEWFSADDVVSVIGQYVRQGWTTTTFMSSDVKMLPPEPETANLLLVQARISRAVSLSYTPDHSTRVVATTSITVCPS